jgi:hypothetical protein
MPALIAEDAPSRICNGSLGEEISRLGGRL